MSKPESVTFSELVELIAKSMSDMTGEQLAAIANETLDRHVEYVGDGFFEMEQ